MILRKVPPAGVVQLPVSLDAAKQHLRVDFDHADLEINSLIETARDWVETKLGRSLINQQWVAVWDCFPVVSAIELPVAPLQSVASLVYVDKAGSNQTLASNKYRVLSDDVTPGLLELVDGETWPETATRSDAVTVTFTAGYGTTATTVPSAARHAILLLVGHWWKNRESTGTATQEITNGVEHLLRTLHTGYVAGAWGS